MADQIQRSVLDPKYRETQEANLAQVPEQTPSWGEALDALAQFMGHANPVKGALSGGVPFHLLVQALKRLQGPSKWEDANVANLVKEIQHPQVRQGVEKVLAQMPSEHPVPLGAGVDFAGVKIGPEVLKFSPKTTQTWTQIERSAAFPKEAIVPLKDAQKWFSDDARSGVVMAHQPYAMPPPRHMREGTAGGNRLQEELTDYFERLFEGSNYRPVDVRPGNVGRLGQEKNYRAFDLGAFWPRESVEDMRRALFPPQARPGVAPQRTEELLLWGQGGR